METRKLSESDSKSQNNFLSETVQPRLNGREETEDCEEDPENGGQSRGRVSRHFQVADSEGINKIRKSHLGPNVKAKEKTQGRSQFLFELFIQLTFYTSC